MRVSRLGSPRPRGYRPRAAPGRTGPGILARRGTALTYRTALRRVPGRAERNSGRAALEGADTRIRRARCCARAQVSARTDAAADHGRDGPAPSRVAVLPAHLYRS